MYRFGSEFHLDCRTFWDFPLALISGPRVGKEIVSLHLAQSSDMTNLLPRKEQANNFDIDIAFHFSAFFVDLKTP